MPKNDIEQRLQRAVEQTTPDVLQQVLERAHMDESNIIEFKPPEKRRAPRIGMRRGLMGIAAALVIFCSGCFYQMQFATFARLSVDVNPSVQLAINRQDRVISATPANDEARQILGDMNLRGVGTDVAINALIGAMVKGGFINDTNNSVLISVDAPGDRAGKHLRDIAVSAANDTLGDRGAVLSQLYQSDAELDQLSRTYQTSLGKAELIRQLIALNPALTFDMLRDLSVHELIMLAASKRLPPKGVSVSGSLNEPGYIGKDMAIETALGELGLQRHELDDLTCEMDYEHGRMVYEVEAVLGSHEFEYTLDALTGEVLEWESEWVHPDINDFDDDL